MYKISTTVKLKYFDQLGITKIHELKKDSEFWRKRLKKLIGRKDIFIVFLCGRMVKRFKVRKIEYLRTVTPIDIDGKFEDTYFRITLGNDLTYYDQDRLNRIYKRYK